MLLKVDILFSRSSAMLSKEAPIKLQKLSNFVVVVVVLLFYVHGKHLRSCWNGHLTTLFLGRLRPPKWLTSTSCTYFRQ